MNEEFTIEVCSGTDMVDCSYIASPFPAITFRKGLRAIELDVPRCHAILRKLAELSEGRPKGNFSIPVTTNRPSIDLSDGFWSEEELIDKLCMLQKHIYQKKTLTAEEKIEKALKILNGARTFQGVYSDIAEAKEILEGS